MITTFSIEHFRSRFIARYIYTNASIKGVLDILNQEDEKGDSKPVADFSKKCNADHKKKKVIYLECLPIKEVVKI